MLSHRLPSPPASVGFGEIRESRATVRFWPIPLKNSAIGSLGRVPRRMDVPDEPGWAVFLLFFGPSLPLDAD
jgi:hypothetical protein